MLDTPSRGIKTIKDYKSTPSRIVHSLGLSNKRLRDKNESRKSEVKLLQVRTYDLEESRNRWKALAKAKEEELEILKKKFSKLEKKTKLR